MVISNQAVVVLAGLSLFLTGCCLPGQVEVAEKRLKALEEKIETITQRMASDEQETKLGSTATLIPGAGGYGVLKSDLGAITVSLEKVQPLAKGSRVIIRFGNTTSVVLTGITAKIAWGSAEDKDASNRADTQSTMIKLGKSVPGGKWAEVAVELSNVPPSKLSFVRVENFTHQGIALSPS